MSAEMSKPEKESCTTCPNRMKCHGKAPEVTHELLVRWVREATLEVLSERKL